MKQNMQMDIKHISTPCGRRVEDLHQHDWLEDDGQNVITHPLRAQDFNRVERLDTFANDTCHMFTDGEIVSYDDTKYSKRRNTFNTR